MVLTGICGAIGSGKSSFAELITSIDPEHSLHLETSTLVVELGNSCNDFLKSNLQMLQSETDLIELGNMLINAIRPQISAIAGKSLRFSQLAIIKADASAHPEWYEKLFIYLETVRDCPELLHNTISPGNKNTYRPLLQWIGGYFLYRLHNGLLWYEELLRRAKNAGPSIRLVALTAPRQPSEAAYVQAAGGKIIKILRPGLVADTSDVTERQVASIRADCEIVNGGSLEDLGDIAKLIYRDLRRDTLKPTYHSGGETITLPQQ